MTAAESCMQTMMEDNPLALSSTGANICTGKGFVARLHVRLDGDINDGRQKVWSMRLKIKCMNLVMGVHIIVKRHGSFHFLTINSRSLCLQTDERNSSRAMLPSQ